MLLIRRFEEKAGQLYGMGLIGGFCHLYIGQEAVVVGMEMPRRSMATSVITSYRDHGHMLACDMDPKGVMAELTGREGGYSKGKGGSMHMFSKREAFLRRPRHRRRAGVARHRPGFANKYRGNDRVTMTYFGDGAANQGQVYESFNMAELWKLPVIFVIENNKYAMGTSVKRSSTSARTCRSAAHPSAFRARQVDGMDVRAVKEAGEKALEHCRSGKGPIHP
jgi:pyruvate dehydrogenase E1 component alpha subunit